MTNNQNIKEELHPSKEGDAFNSKENKTEIIKVSKELKNYLSSQRDVTCKTFEEVIWRFIREEKQDE